MSGNPFGVVIPPDKGDVNDDAQVFLAHLRQAAEQDPGTAGDLRRHTPVLRLPVPQRPHDAPRAILSPEHAPARTRGTPNPQRPAQEQPVTLPPAARSLARGLAWAAAGLTIAAIALGVLWLLG